jgi:parallel beta-helix repeat protein
MNQKNIHKMNHAPYTKQHALVTLLTICIFLIFPNAHANIVFSLANSPYYLSEDLIVDNHDTIVFEAGVTVYMEENINIITNGVIMMNGTSENPVSILPKNEGIGWGIIEINCPDKQSFITNAFIVEGTILSWYCDMILDQTTFINNHDLAWNVPILFVRNASVNINRSSIYSNNTGEGFQMLNSESVIVKNCYFSKAPDAIELTNIVGGQISHNWIENGNDDGIDLNNCTSTLIDSNTIINAVDRGIEIGSENNGNSENIIVKRNVLIGCNVGVIIKEESYGQVINNTFFNNQIGVRCIENNTAKSGSYMNVQNCIFSNSTNADISKDSASTMTINYCISNSGILPGENNLMGDPLFVDASVYDFCLQENSPCINAGNPSFPNDPDNTIADIGAFYFNTDTTSINENFALLESLKIYPNPFIDRISISTKNQTRESFSLELFSLDGKIIPYHVVTENTSIGSIYNINLESFYDLNRILICKISIQGTSRSYTLIQKTK